MRWLRTPRAILLAGWVLFLAYAWPGYMSTDSVAQLVEVREGWRTDLASPVVTMLWSVLELIVAGPVGMLVVQSGLLLFGTYALLGRAMSARAAAIGAGVVLCFPPVATTMAVIWPDSMMIGALVAGAAAVTCERRGVKIAGLALLALAAAARDAALIAIAPIVVTGFRWRPGPRWRVIATAALTWLAVAACAWTANRALTDERVAPYAGTLVASDIIGIEHFARLPEARLDDALAGTSRIATRDIVRLARERYDKRAVYTLTHGDERVFDHPLTADARDAMVSVWRDLVTAHPGAYFRHRWHVFGGVLGVYRRGVWLPVYTRATEGGAQTYTASHDAAHSAVQSALVATYGWLGGTFLFHAYLYLALALALLPLAIARRHADAACFLGAGLLHAAATFVLAISPEYRFAHALVTTTVIATVLLFVRSKKPQH